VWVSIVYLLLHDFEFQILKVSKAMAALDDSLDHVIESFGKTGKGLKPLKLLLGIDVHVLKDVAIAPTFRSGIKKSPKIPKGFSPFSQKAFNLS
jgi:hypothetical protein